MIVIARGIPGSGKTSEGVVDKKDLKPGDVVQIDPRDGNPFGGCFMTITVIKESGAHGFVAIPAPKGVPASESSHVSNETHYFAPWGKMELIGEAKYVPEYLAEIAQMFRDDEDT